MKYYPILGYLLLFTLIACSNASHHSDSTTETSSQTPTNTSTTLISQDDLVFVGGFKLPEDIQYNSGLTVRNIGGVKKLYTIRFAGTEKGYMYEVEVPDTLDTTYPFEQLDTYVNWEDIYQDTLVDTVSNGSSGTPPYVGLSGGASIPSGLYWDEEDQRMYWTKVVNYNNTSGESDASLGFSTLDDHTHTGTGIASWRLDKPASAGGYGARYGFSFCAIPQQFADTYLRGKRLALGFGGGSSIVSNGVPSIGPALFAFDPPDPNNETFLDYLTTPPQRLLSHFAYGESWALRPEELPGLSFRALGGGQSEYWFLEDRAKYGVWIDNGEKQGILIWVLMGAGEADTVVTQVTNNSEFTVADAGDLQANDIIRIYTDHEPSALYPFEQPRIASVSGNTITLTQATTGNISSGAVVQGGNWYAGGGPSTTRYWTPLYLYDPEDIALVAQGTLDANEIDPYENSNFALEGGQYPFPGSLPGTSGVNAFIPRGLAYDQQSGYIFFAAREEGGAGTDIWVYQLK